MKAQGLARWSLLFAVSGSLLLLVGVSTVRETYQQWKVDQEIRGLQAQVEAMEGKKSDLTDLLARLQSPDALDREARARLGMRKAGERVVVVRDADPMLDGPGGPAAAPAEPEAPPDANPHKWLRYFFFHP